MIKNIDNIDILALEDAELDTYIAENEVDFNENMRGRAYKRVQRRNHIEKRIKQMNSIRYMPVDNDIRYIKQFAKLHCGCRRARCGVCHYSKKYDLPTRETIMLDIKMKDQLKEI